MKKDTLLRAALAGLSVGLAASATSLAQGYGNTTLYLILGGLRVEADRGFRLKAGERHRDGAVGRKSQGVIAISPVFYECDVWMCEGCKC